MDFALLIQSSRTTIDPDLVYKSNNNISSFSLSKLIIIWCRKNRVIKNKNFFSTHSRSRFASMIFDLHSRAFCIQWHTIVSFFPWRSIDSSCALHRKKERSNDFLSLIRFIKRKKKRQHRRERSNWWFDKCFIDSLLYRKTTPFPSRFQPFFG